MQDSGIWNEPDRGRRAAKRLDPLTHSLLGAATARATAGRWLGRAAMLPGAIGAVLPDLDTLIRSASDPLLYAEYHRHFTHALLFMPVGALLAATPWLLDRKRTRVQRLAVIGAAGAGYATHGLLDATTTYGTQLLWPLSSARIGLSWISIIDPIFTLVLLVGVVVALARRSGAPATLAVALAVAYLGAGAIQRGRVAEAQARIAESRGHRIEREVAIPTFGNQIVWRALYLSGDSIHFDRVRLPWFGPAEWTPIAGSPLFTESDLNPRVRAAAPLARDFRRFQHFSSGWVTLDPVDPTVIGDARYSRIDDGLEAVWGIRLDASGSGAPTEWVDRSRDREMDLRRLWHQVTGRSGEFQPLPAARGAGAAGAAAAEGWQR